MLRGRGFRNALENKLSRDDIEYFFLIDALKPKQNRNVQKCVIWACYAREKPKNQDPHIQKVHYHIDRFRNPGSSTSQTILITVMSRILMQIVEFHHSGNTTRTILKPYMDP
jgi:hypothetical protein